jgi:hypothetical protein
MRDRNRTPTPIEVPLRDSSLRDTSQREASLREASLRGAPYEDHPLPQLALGYQDGSLSYPRELTPVPVPVENSGGMDIKRLRVPLPMMISFLVGIISIAVAVTTVWLKTESHILTREAHIDIGEATRGGGVAYKNDVEKARLDLEKKIRKSLKSARVTCRRDSTRDALNCDIYFQEE